MSTTKRSRARQQDAGASGTPPAKRTKLHDQHDSLAFLTDERQRAGRTVTAKTTNGVGTTKRIDRVDESKHAVHGGEADAGSDDHSDDESSRQNGQSEGEASVAAESSEEPSSESDGDDDCVQFVEERPLTNGVNHHGQHEPNQGHGKVTSGRSLTLTNGDTKPDGARGNGEKVVDGHDKDMQDDTGPSFGDMLQAAHPDVIDVASTFQDPTASRAIVSYRTPGPLQTPQGTSLGTVLTQALRTNDKELLESCLQLKDLQSIKSTIQRLPPPLVSTLMQKLAERLHKRPGRAGSLMVWVQWSLVVHGGYLATQHGLVRKLRALRTVVRERASSLQSLIVLKGKLDMLSAQVELRRGIKAQRAYEDQTDEDGTDVVYVEGAENESFSSDDDEGALPVEPRQAAKGNKDRKNAPASNGDLEMDGDIPLINGVDEDAEVESLVDGQDDEDDDADEPNKFIDDEAEESGVEDSMSSEEDNSGSESDEEDDQDVISSASEEDPIEAATATAKPGRPVKRNALIRKR